MYRLAVSDFDNDGRMDVAATTDGGFDLLLGNGDGTFAAPISFNVPAEINNIYAADMNRDGNTDLVINVGVFAGFITVLDGDGHGGFEPTAARLPASGSEGQIQVLDLNGDGIPDIVEVGVGFELNVYYGLVQGRFSPTYAYAISETGVAFGLVDL